MLPNLIQRNTALKKLGTEGGKEFADLKNCVEQLIKHMKGGRESMRECAVRISTKFVTAGS